MKKSENLSKLPSSRSEDRRIKWISPYRRALKPGFYWARRMLDLSYELVEIRFIPGQPSNDSDMYPIEVVTMGWGSTETIEKFVDYVPAVLISPTGIYRGLHEE